LDIGLPPSLHQLLSDHSNDQGTARGGCDDGFGVFGFLAFLLALLDLLLELGGDGRKKRSIGDEGICDLPNPHPQVREGTLAALVMLRGFLNAVEPLDEANSQECAALAICEASTEAARLGEVISSHNGIVICLGYPSFYDVSLLGISPNLFQK